MPKANAFDRAWVAQTLIRHAEDIRSLGTLAAERFGSGGRTQIANLERIALQALAFEEIEMFIKRQAGQGAEKKGTKGAWVAGNPRFADEALALLEKLRNASLERNADPEVIVHERVPERLAGAAFRDVHSVYLFQVGARG